MHVCIYTYMYKYKYIYIYIYKNTCNNITNYYVHVYI